MIHGKVWKFGHHIDTDIIIPARFLVASDPAFLAPHCMEGERPGFADKVTKGDILVAGENFGCGSSREHAPICIKAAGISCVVATSFARIFYRNAINIGLPVFETPGVWEKTEEGDTLDIDPQARIIRNAARNLEVPFEPFPPFIEEIINTGGLMAWIRKNYAHRVA